MRRKTDIKQKLLLLVLIVFSMGVFLQSMGGVASASTLTSTSIRFDRMAAAQATLVRLTFTVPVGNSATEASVKIAFPDAYTIATTGLTGSGASCGATALPGSLTVTGNNTNGQKSLIVGGVTNLTASTSYCVDIDKTTTHDPVTNAAAGSYSLTVTTRDSGPADIDSTVVGAYTVTDDQIVVSATVPTAFTFVLDANTTSFTTNLSTGSIVQTTLRTATVTTNASAGWVAWAKDSNTGLTSAAAGKTIASTTPGSAATLSTGAEGYVLGVDKTDAGGGGTVTVTAAYAGTSGDNNGSGLDTTYRQIGSANGTANGDVLKLYGKAGISGTTPAGNDYTDTWTVIGAGTF